MSKCNIRDFCAVFLIIYLLLTKIKKENRFVQVNVRIFVQSTFFAKLDKKTDMSKLTLEIFVQFFSIIHLLFAKIK